MKYIIITVFLLTYITNPDIGYTQTSPLYTHFIYMFAHANGFHLGLNLLSFLSLFRFLNRVIPALPLFLYAYSSAVIASFLSPHHLPTVGASGMVCSLVALYAILPLLRRKLIIADKIKYRRWILLTALALTIPSFFPTINTSNHLFSLLFGAAFALIDHLLNNRKPHARLR